jgi:CheY-like chemotaxis protein
LVVENDPTQLAATRDVLRGAGYRVASAGTFREAQQLLALEPPELLIADVRLGAFNGLHLLVMSRPDHPEMAAIITCVSPDPVLEADAKQYGAVYLVKPISPVVLLSAVSDALVGKSPKSSAAVRRWPRKKLVGVMTTVAHFPATVLDIGYGGLQFEIHRGPEDRLPPTFEVDVPGFAVSVNAKLVWTDRIPPFRTYRSGAALTEARSDAVRAWQRFVDGVAEPPGDTGEPSSSGSR